MVAVEICLVPTQDLNKLYQQRELANANKDFPDIFQIHITILLELIHIHRFKDHLASHN